MRPRMLAWILLVALLAVACGQRPGIYAPIAGDGGAGGFSGEEGTLASDGGFDGGSVDGADGTAAAGQPGSGALEAGASNGVAQDGPSGAAGRAVQSVDDGPVWGDEIRIGIHAPVTGAASLKADAFDAGRELYWKHLENNDIKVHGRTVRVVFKDDQYDPSTAATLCKEMVEGQDAFMLVGAAGTDQIVTCAQYAATKGVPYLSAGVTENAVAQLRNYFAISMSYPDQGPLLARHLKELASTDACRSNGVTCDDQLRVGLIVSDTPNFDDAAEGFSEAFQKEFGRDVDYFKVVSKNPSQQEATQQATELRRWSNGRGVDVVYILSSVTFVVNVASSLDDGYRPRFAGVGITMVNQGVDLSCPKGAFEGARYYNPFPAWANRNDYDPAFDQAVQAQQHANQNVPNGGDLMWSLWSVSRVIHKALEHTGKNLTRGGFIRAMESFSYDEKKAYPSLAFSPKNHFGAQGAHLLEARCETQGNSRGQFFQLKDAWG